MELDPKANLITLLERSRDIAEAMLENSGEYAKKQLRRHIDAMNAQIDVVNGTADYTRKEKKSNAPSNRTDVPVPAGTVLCK